ncbi:hypothetical protein RO575_22395 [Methylomonas sp. MO1]|uniref:hypothetical protein n=1 Tax=Methylomonas sp. MO1 TaxID=3073619 RepID=UPI0028A48CFC|nr:hypothetical protein [Methylomonas sp. MO1]MDT4292326.1 hypothetical protein [Methylomonas sp. MO1]
MTTKHGFIKCDACKGLFSCHDRDGSFERWGEGETIRLINNPAQWGTDKPTYRLLGFSKGDTQNQAMSDAKLGKLSFEEIPFNGKVMRHRLDQLLTALELKSAKEPIDSLFRPTEQNFQSSSLIRCSISALNAKGKYSYELKEILASDAKSGGKVREILHRCTSRHLTNAKPGETFIMLGLEKELIAWSKELFERHFGKLKTIHETTYRNADLSFAHVAHPSGRQTNPQYLKWCEGAYKKPKVRWALDELHYRKLKVKS